MHHTSSKFYTTTTASGMPMLENEPLDRERSLALRDVTAHISAREKGYSVHKIGRDHVGFCEGRLGSGSSHKDCLSTISTTSCQSNVSNSEASKMDDSGSQTASRFMSGQMATLEDNSVMDSLVTEVEAESDKSSNSLTTITERTSVDRSVAKRTGDSKGVEPVANGDDEVLVFNAHKFYSFTKYKRPSVSCDLEEYTSNNHLDMFENVAIWDYPIFELEEKAGNHILSHMAHRLFREAGLMETFHIPQREFINYFRALEANYGSNIYHNKTHAADVLHAVSFLLFEIIPEFSHKFQTNDTAQERKVDSHMSGTSGNIASAISILEVLACYMASAMHDFDHPGRTNAFLVGTQSYLALLYNDRSVLENHHAAASWHLLNNFAENNFLVSMEEAEMKRLRFLVIEAILATDLKMHFDLLAKFRAKTNPKEEGRCINWAMEMDRLLVMKMVIKMADINTPTKNFDHHRNWSQRITEEFYQQSEEEAALGIPGTIHMDRKHPEKLPAIQVSFIQNLVSPLFKACADARILPGILEAGFGKDSAFRTASSTGKSAEVNEDAIESEVTEVEEPKFMSIILTNLQINFERWKAELLEEDAVAKSEKADDAKKTLQDEEGVESQGGEEVEPQGKVC